MESMSSASIFRSGYSRFFIMYPYRSKIMEVHISFYIIMSR